MAEASMTSIFMLYMSGTFSGSGLNSTRILMRFLYHRSKMGSVTTQFFWMAGKYASLSSIFQASLESLITNDFDLCKEKFRQCYFLRWPVEENYKLIKEKIGLINFRGYSENSVLQEFWISMLLANLALAIKRETDGIIDSTINQKENKHRYMTNKNELVGYL